MVVPEGIEPNRQPPIILRQGIYSPPIGTGTILKHTTEAATVQPNVIGPLRGCSVFWEQCVSIWHHKLWSTIWQGCTLPRSLTGPVTAWTFMYPVRPFKAFYSGPTVLVTYVHLLLCSSDRCANKAWSSCPETSFQLGLTLLVSAAESALRSS